MAKIQKISGGKLFSPPLRLMFGENRLAEKKETTHLTPKKLNYHA